MTEGISEDESPVCKCLTELLRGDRFCAERENAFGEVGKSLKQQMCHVLSSFFFVVWYLINVQCLLKTDDEVKRKMLYVMQRH